MGKVIVGRFPKKPVPKKKPGKKGLALTHGATADGRVRIAANFRGVFTTAEVTALLQELRETRNDAIARRRARG